MNKDEFRAQNSINLSIALIAAAFALMAGVLAAFFAVADKIPTTISGAIIRASTIVSILGCTTSVLLGGRGISATIASTTQATFPTTYDNGNFARQSVAGLIGTVAVVVMIALSITIRSERPSSSAADDAASRASVKALEDRVLSLESRTSEISQRLDRLSSEQAVLSANVQALAALPRKGTIGKKSEK